MKWLVIKLLSRGSGQHYRHFFRSLKGSCRFRTSRCFLGGRNDLKFHGVSAEGSKMARVASRAALGSLNH